VRIFRGLTTPKTETFYSTSRIILVLRSCVFSLNFDRTSDALNRQNQKPEEENSGSSLIVRSSSITVYVHAYRK